MALSTEEKIIRLKRGIASKETPDAIRAIMQSDLDELLNPEPVYTPPVAKEKPKKAVKVKVTAKKKEEPIAEIKVPEPPLLTDERKKAMMEEYAKEKARKKAKEEYN